MSSEEGEDLVFLAVRVTPELKRAFKAETARRGLTLQEALPEAVQAWLEDNPSE